ncbi:MAG: hypothetical protein R3F49_01185 [Planctomycetota bacterium]
MTRAAGHARTLRPGWVISPGVDAAMFTGSLALGLAVVAGFAAAGRLDAAVPAWLFVLLVACVDVAHVYATAFRVYLDPARFRRHPALFIGAPLAVLALGQLAWSVSPLAFWRALAYLAVFHFVRQQWGWVAYTRRRAGEGGDDRRLDMAVAYAGTVAPLVYWHSTLPREIAWFVDGDFLRLPAWLGAAALGLSACVHAAFALRQVQRARARTGVNWAKLHVVATTSVSWFLAIVVFDSDVAFTALNVLGHGVPYLVVVWHVEARVARDVGTPCARLFRPGLRSAALFLGALALLGYGEEWLWHQLVWLDQLEAFPGPLAAGSGERGAWALSLLVPLLAMPQATHYVLDGWLWRVGANPDVEALFVSQPAGQRRDQRGSSG